MAYFVLATLTRRLHTRPPPISTAARSFSLPTPRFFSSVPKKLKKLVKDKSDESSGVEVDSVKKPKKLFKGDESHESAAIKMDLVLLKMKSSVMYLNGFLCKLYAIGLSSLCTYHFSCVILLIHNVFNLTIHVC
jgi:hypothetical protein